MRFCLRLSIRIVNINEVGLGIEGLFVLFEEVRDIVLHNQPEPVTGSSCFRS